MGINKPKEHHGHRRRVFAVIGLILCLATVAFFSQDSQDSELDRQARTRPHQIAVARADAEKQADAKRDAQVKVFQDAGIGQHVASSKIDACYVVSSDGGLFPMSWLQYCYLRYVEGYVTNLDRATAAQRLRLHPMTEGWFGNELEQWSGNMESCNLFSKEHRETVRFRPVHVPITYGCELPEQDRGALYGPTYSEDLVVAKVYRTFDSDSLDADTAQVWTTFDEYYYKEDLGCGGGFLACDNPRSKPVHAP